MDSLDLRGYRNWLITAAMLIPLSGAALASTTERVSIDSDGLQGNSHSFASSISADGRLVAIWSRASNLVPDDTNGVEDIFVHDRETGLTERVSIDSFGGQADNASGDPSISASGRFLAFVSIATNLVPDDTNGIHDVFVHDRETGLTERVSIDSAGSQGNGSSRQPSISTDGRFVAFWSFASNLVPDDTNGATDVFVHDRETGLTERVSIGSDGEQGDGTSFLPSISADGRFVAFESRASNLVPDDTNGTTDVFVNDRETGLTERVSIDSGGGQGNRGSRDPSISADGRNVAFTSSANNLVLDDAFLAEHIFVHDLETGLTEQVSIDSDGGQGNGGSGSPSISADGRFVSFVSSATNLVPDDTNGIHDVFVHDCETGLTERVSISSGGGQGSRESVEPSISADGRFVAFRSFASNLVPDDTNGVSDIFVHDRGELVSLPPPAVSSKATVDSSAVIGNGSVIDQGAVISAGVTIGTEVLIDKSVFIGENVTIGNQVQIDRDTVVENGAWIGDGVTIGRNSLIGANAMIGAGAVLEKEVTVAPGVNVPAGAGIPAGSVVN